MRVTMKDFFPESEPRLEDFYPEGSDAYFARITMPDHPAALLPPTIAPAFLRILTGIQAGTEAQIELVKIMRFCDWQLKTLGMDFIRK